MDNMNAEAGCEGSLSASVESADCTTIEDMPAIRDWGPSLASGAIGVVCFFALWSLVAFVVGSLCGIAFGVGAFSRDIGTLAAGVLQLVIMLVYALAFYPSYFTGNPALGSSNLISFANYFAGGIVFGWCWNNNIKSSKITKRPDKGSSYVVAIVIAGVGLASSALSAVLSIVEFVLW